MNVLILISLPFMLTMVLVYLAKKFKSKEPRQWENYLVNNKKYWKVK